MATCDLDTALPTFSFSFQFSFLVAFQLVVDRKSRLCVKTFQSRRLNRVRFNGVGFYLEEEVGQEEVGQEEVGQEEVGQEEAGQEEVAGEEEAIKRGNWFWWLPLRVQVFWTFPIENDQRNE